MSSNLQVHEFFFFFEFCLLLINKKSVQFIHNASLKCTFVFLRDCILRFRFRHDPPFDGKVPPAVHSVRRELGVVRNYSPSRVHRSVHYGGTREQHPALPLDDLMCARAQA